MRFNTLRTFNQLRKFPKGIQAVVFAVVTDKDERYHWTQQTLIELC